MVRKTEIRQPLSHTNAGASNLADDADLETPDGSIIFNGSQGIGKTSYPGQDDGHASRQRRGAQASSRAMDHAARRAAPLSGPYRDPKRLRPRPMPRLP